MNMEFLGSTEGKIRWDEIRNEIFREIIGIKNVLIELEEKLLQRFDYVKEMERTRKSRMAIK
jgi:hypothetical protein